MADIETWLIEEYQVRKIFMEKVFRKYALEARPRLLFNSDKKPKAASTFFFNWDLLHAKLKGHYNSWSYKKKKKKIKIK